MPIIGWFCKHCRANVPLDHYDHCNSVHPDYAAAILGDSSEKHREGVYLTSGLGCPRKGAIEKVVGSYVDPLGYNAMLGGAAWHKLMEKYTKQPELVEVPVAGLLGGIQVVGRVDRLRPPVWVEDWKVGNDFAEKYVKDGPKAEVVAQLSVYAELVEQTLGWRPTKGRIWNRFHGKGILPVAVELWPIDQALGFRPFGGDYSVGELLRQGDHFLQWLAGTTPLRCEWQDMPLAGETQKFGGSKTMCDYCSVREVCYTQAYKAPF